MDDILHVSYTDVPCADWSSRNHQVAVCYTASREFHPNCCSDRVAPIAWDCGWTGVPLSFRLSLPYWGQPNIHKEGSRSARWTGMHGIPCCCGVHFHSLELMYLMNGYLLLNFQQRSKIKVSWSASYRFWCLTAAVKISGGLSAAGFPPYHA